MTKGERERERERKRVRERERKTEWEKESERKKERGIERERKRKRERVRERYTETGKFIATYQYYQCNKIIEISGSKLTIDNWFKRVGSRDGPKIVMVITKVNHDNKYYLNLKQCPELMKRNINNN